MSDQKIETENRRNDAPDPEILTPEVKAPEKSTSSLKDYLSLIFSAMALLISGLSFYTTNIKIEDNAMARIVKMDIEPGDAADSGNGSIKGWIVAHTAFINVGNRPAIVMGAEYILKASGVNPKPNDTGVALVGFGDDIHTAKKIFPLVLPSHESQVVDLRIPIKHMVDNYESGGPVPVEDSPSRSSKNRAFDLQLEFRTLDSKGAEHSGSSTNQGPIGVSRTGWAFMRGGDRKPIPLLTGQGER